MAFSSRTRLWRALSLGVLVGSLAACGASTASVSEAEHNETSPDVAEGRRLFFASCAGCHGARGDGKGEAAERLFPPPRNLTRGEYRFRSTASGALPTREDLHRTISLGLPGSAMPAWRDLYSPRQIASLVLYLETLSTRFSREVRGSEERLIASDLRATPSTPALVTRGRDLYAKMGCGECHGSQGRGDGKAAATARNSDGSVSHVFDFSYGVYKGGNSPTDVYRTFMTGLDGAPMPAFDQSLPEEADRWALVAYVLSLGRARGVLFYLTERPSWHDPLADAAPYAAPAAAAAPPSSTPAAAPAEAVPGADGW